MRDGVHRHGSKRRDLHHIWAFFVTMEKCPYMREWDSVWDLRGLSFKGIIYVFLIKAKLKALTRWYLVASHLSRLFPNSSPSCFWGCYSCRTMHHIWWEYPRLRGFWIRVYVLLRWVTGVPVPQKPRIALLNDPPEKVLWATQKYIFFYSLGS